MDSVVTVIAHMLSEEFLGELIAKLKHEGARATELVWLAPAHAADILLTGMAPSQAQQLTRAAIGTLPIDFHAQYPAHRRKRILVADMDSTMITSETMDDLASASPFQAEIDAITNQSVKGEIDFAEGLRQRVRLLEGMDGTVFNRVRAAITLSPGSKALVATMRAHGAYTALVSGGFTYFAQEVARALGFDEVQANDLPVIDGRAAGSLSGPILDAPAKAFHLARIAAEHGLTPNDAAAIGDGSNDIPLLLHAGLGCAYRGKPLVRQAIVCQLNYADLTGLLYYQGYRHDEFVQAKAENIPNQKLLHSS
ncbi:MAG TPA: phosphoserine phosphatase SerB [Dongiaceae bacterium]|nr:phosphoserine phosphatase SerB [Dongiaceae bacterium]